MTETLRLALRAAPRQQIFCGFLLRDPEKTRALIELAVTPLIPCDDLGEVQVVEDIGWCEPAPKAEAL